MLIPKLQTLLYQMSLTCIKKRKTNGKHICKICENNNMFLVKVTIMKLVIINKNF